MREGDAPAVAEFSFDGKAFSMQLLGFRTLAQFPGDVSQIGEGGRRSQPVANLPASRQAFLIQSFGLCILVQSLGNIAQIVEGVVSFLAKALTTHPPSG